MKKLLLFLIIFFSCASGAFAQNEKFEISGNFTYELTNSDLIKVREEIHLKNLTTQTYAPSFSFDTTGFAPDDVMIYENGVATKATKTDEHIYSVTLRKPALGVGATKTIVIQFTDSTLINKHGNILEIKIPRVGNINQFSSLTTTVRVPEQHTGEFHIFPKKDGVINKKFTEYTFHKSDLENGSIDAFVGNVAAYDFELTYPFTNSSFFQREVTFALPPDTPLQKVIIHSFSQKPESLSYDADGNWIGKLTLPARKNTDFYVQGSVIVFSEPQDNFPLTNTETVKMNLSPQKYWESHDPEIVKLGQTLTTPKAIYDYVIQTLTYDNTKTSRPQERLGAKAALGRTSEAICMEFTDLFIAIARAAHIPAREVNGFALATDSNHPRSLGQDVLHSWPEYWDEELKVWVPVDPTWGKTTGGGDYFSHFDLNHVAFVIHGVNSTTPQTPGTYQDTKESRELIRVEPSENPVSSNQVAPVIRIQKNGIGLWQTELEVTVDNQGGSALYNLPVQTFFDDKFHSNSQIVSILPFSYHSFKIPVYAGFFGSKLPHSVKVVIGGAETVFPVSQFEILTIHLFLFILPLVFIPLLLMFYFKKHEKN